MQHIASCSFGKDSLAMILRLIEENKPLRRIAKNVILNGYMQTMSKKLIEGGSVNE